MVRAPHWGRQNPCGLAALPLVQPAQRGVKDRARPFARLCGETGQGHLGDFVLLPFSFLSEKVYSVPRVSQEAQSVWVALDFWFLRSGFSPFSLSFLSLNGYFIYSFAVCSGDGVHICSQGPHQGS